MIKKRAISGLTASILIGAIVIVLGFSLWLSFNDAPEEKINLDEENTYEMDENGDIITPSIESQASGSSGSSSGSSSGEESSSGGGSSSGGSSSGSTTSSNVTANQTDSEENSQVNTTASDEDDETQTDEEDDSSVVITLDDSLIQIENWEDLYNVRNNLNGSYILVANLDSSSAGYDQYASSNANDGKGWMPIGGEIVCDENALPTTENYFSSCTGMFKGSFNGDGKSISNLFINNSEFDLNLDPQFSNSLFDWIGPKGKIENLHLLDVVIISKGKRNSAGLFYSASHATIENVHVTGNITSLGGNAGGIGNSGLGVQIYNSSFEGNVEGNSSVGGLLGSGGIGNVIFNSYASANVKGKTNVGGLLGNAGYGVLVNSSYSSGNVEGEQNVGGLLGYSVYGVKMNDCYSVSDVEGNSGVGGLIGNGHIHQITIKNSYSSGKIEGSSYVGGFFGGDQSYSTATNPQSVNNFFDKDSSGQSKGASNFIGKTTSEMKTLSTFTAKGWDIKAVADINSRDTSSKWNVVEGNSYPFLSWQ
jgi:hypothetical protein